MKIPEKFLQLFSDPAPALRAEYGLHDEQAKTIRVRHRLGSAADASSQAYLDSLRAYENLGEFLEFYQEHDGVELCKTHHARYGEERPLLELKPAKSIAAFSSRYGPEGDRGWIIDLNKSKALYRSSAPWIAFAEIDSGPMCLTTFLDGENAGLIFFAAPEPRFNILRPIAKGLLPLLDRIGRDLPAFLKLIRAGIVLRGEDGQNYGFKPVGYVSNVEEMTAP